MNPNVKFAIMVIISIIIGIGIAFLWAKFSLFLGAILKKHYTAKLTLSNLDDSSYHSRNQRQQSEQKIKPAKGIKNLYKVYHYWIISNIDRVFEPLYRHFDSSPEKQNQDNSTKNKDDNRNPESPINTIHSEKLTYSKQRCQPKKNDTEKTFLLFVEPCPQLSYFCLHFFNLTVVIDYHVGVFYPLLGR